MYKINIKVSELFLIETEEKYLFDTDTENTLLINYHGSIKILVNYIDMLEKSIEHKRVVIISKNILVLKNDFKSLVTTIKAAGGLVYNEKNEILFIYRRGFWDLPKGKLEKGETKKEAAIREVEEECGVEKLEIVSKLSKTRHLYKSKKGKRMMKLSYWYLMRTNNQRLTPQLEEDIELAVWMSKDKFLDGKLRLYPSLYRILNHSS